MIENMKGVINASVHRQPASSVDEKEADEWMDTLHSIKRDVDPSVIDLDDDRTRYIMGK